MKKIFVSLILFLAVSFLPKNISAYQQTESTCYSQCLAYRFVWQGTYCYDVFADNCTEEKGNTIIKTIKFLKTIYNVVKSGDNIDIPFTAMFVCKPLIESCIVPNQQECTQICQQNNLVYAPDLSVGHPESSFQGVYYDETSKQLYFKLVNNGMGYAWDIDVESTYGHTLNRDGVIQNNQQLFKEKVEHLIFFGARNGPPKSFSDTVTDFLINEAENGQYLKSFKKWLLDDLKSDKNDYNVPSYWIKAVPFTPRPGELNRITFKVDPNQVIPELWEQNNTFILDIDLRPTPARYSIETFSQQIVDGTLNSFLVNFNVENTGEESGRANVKIYDGKYQEGKDPVYQTEESIDGKGTRNFETTINLNLSSDSNPYCGKYKQYTIVVFDAEGNKTERKFSLPIYLGSVSGSVKDLFGKPILGATIMVTTGQTSQSGKYGYDIKGITTLGKMMITATHPEYSKPESKEIEFIYGNEFDACKVGNLLLNSVNFVLKDQDVLFTIYIKDTSGNPVKANVIAVNSDWRFNETIDGNGPLPGMQPGKYIFTISAAGYKTISQDINAVPNNQHLEFTLEKLPGRPDDASLHLIAPKLLWKKTLGTGEKIVSNISDSKNGNLLVAYALNNKAKNSNLYFLDLITGKLIKETPVPYALGYERDVGLDTSYDGRTVGLNSEIKTSKGWDHIMKIFDSSGNEFGSKPLEYFTKGKGGVVTQMDVSPDGFYLCTGGLFNKGLHKYTRYETEGKMDYTRGSTETVNCGHHFLRNNNIITSCEGKQEGYCEKTLANQQVRTVGSVDEGISAASTIFDSAFDSKTTVIRTYAKLYYFGASAWKKELESDSMYKSVAVSPGGMYTIVTAGNGSSTLLKLKIFGNTGGDKTPDFPYKNVKFVFANDKGLFFAQVELNKIEFYQVGEYQTEYKPDIQVSPTPETSPSGLYHFANGRFDPAGNLEFGDLIAGDIYMAGRNINFDMGGGNGTLHILNGTYFSVDQNHRPIILRGQLTADFNSPTTVYAIKFDRFLMDLFKTKLGQFIAGTLPTDEYFIVQNIHTKFTVKNNEGKFNVMVDKGEVKVTGDKINMDIKQGRQIIIDKNSEIKVTGYINFRTISIIIGLIILILGTILFYYRKTKVGKKIIEILKKIGAMIRKGIELLFQFLINIIKKLFSKKYEK